MHTRIGYAKVFAMESVRIIVKTGMTTPVFRQSAPTDRVHVAHFYNERLR